MRRIRVDDIEHTVDAGDSNTLLGEVNLKTTQGEFPFVAIYEQNTFSDVSGGYTIEAYNTPYAYADLPATPPSAYTQCCIRWFDANTLVADTGFTPTNTDKGYYVCIGLISNDVVLPLPFQHVLFLGTYDSATYVGDIKLETWVYDPWK